MVTSHFQLTPPNILPKIEHTFVGAASPHLKRPILMGAVQNYNRKKLPVKNNTPIDQNSDDFEQEWPPKN